MMCINASGHDVYQCEKCEFELNVEEEEGHICRLVGFFDQSTTQFFEQGTNRRRRGTIPRGVSQKIFRKKFEDHSRIIIMFDHLDDGFLVETFFPFLSGVSLACLQSVSRRFRALLQHPRLDSSVWRRRYHLDFGFPVAIAAEEQFLVGTGIFDEEDLVEVNASNAGVGIHHAGVKNDNNVEELLVHDHADGDVVEKPRTGSEVLVQKVPRKLESSPRPRTSASSAPRSTGSAAPPPTWRSAYLCRLRGTARLCHTLYSETQPHDFPMDEVQIPVLLLAVWEFAFAGDRFESDTHKGFGERQLAALQCIEFMAPLLTTPRSRLSGDTEENYAGEIPVDHGDHAGSSASSSLDANSRGPGARMRTSERRLMRALLCGKEKDQWPKITPLREHSSTITAGRGPQHGAEKEETFNSSDHAARFSVEGAKVFAIESFLETSSLCYQNFYSMFGADGPDGVGMQKTRTVEDEEADLLQELRHLTRDPIDEHGAARERGDVEDDENHPDLIPPGGATLLAGRTYQHVAGRGFAATYSTTGRGRNNLGDPGGGAAATSSSTVEILPTPPPVLPPDHDSSCRPSASEQNAHDLPSSPSEKNAPAPALQHRQILARLSHFLAHSDALSKRNLANLSEAVEAWRRSGCVAAPLNPTPLLVRVQYPTIVVRAFEVFRNVAEGRRAADSGGRNNGNNSLQPGLVGFEGRFQVGGREDTADASALDTDALRQRIAAGLEAEELRARRQAQLLQEGSPPADWEEDWEEDGWEEEGADG